MSSAKYWAPRSATGLRPCPLGEPAPVSLFGNTHHVGREGFLNTGLNPGRERQSPQERRRMFGLTELTAD
eukprot:1320638-Heterocapsa_arctica.AAC.1